MRITTVINIKGNRIPSSISSSSLYTLSSQNTMMGFHKRVRQNNLNIDTSCTKTNLLLFVHQQDAIDVVKTIDQTQGKILRFTRDIDFINRKSAILDNTNDIDVSKYKLNNSKVSMNIEAIPYNYLEKLCSIHYFDMLIVYNKTITEIANDRYELDLECYEFNTTELPNRMIQENILRDLLY